MMVTSDMDVLSSCDGFNNHHIGTLRCRQEGASTPSTEPVLCLTATAKPEVVRDIRDHFQTRLGVDLMLLDGGAVRTNLSFAVLPTQKATKLTDILSAIEANLPPEGASGAVVYCATRGATEKVAEFLKGQGLAADYFHAGLPPDRKRDVQEAFRTGQLRVIAATNAFGVIPPESKGLHK